MPIFLQRLILGLLLVILQRSFFDILWPNLGVPSVMISASIVLVFIMGFHSGLNWVLGISFLYLLLGEVSYFPVFAVAIAYATSFLSRRLMIEHELQSLITLLVIAVLATIGYGIFGALSERGNVSVGMLFLNACETGIVFFPVFWIIRWREQSIAFGLASEFRGLRK